MRMWEKEDAYEEDGRWRLRMQAEGEVAKLDCGSGFRASRVELSVRRRSGGREGGGVGKREKREREREREMEGCQGSTNPEEVSPTGEKMARESAKEKEGKSKSKD
jgi:hypothetical protein